MIRLINRFLIFGFAVISFNQGLCQDIGTVIGDTLVVIPISKIPDYEIKTKDKFLEVNAFISSTSSLSNWIKAIDDLKIKIEVNSKIIDSIDLNTLGTANLQKWDLKWSDIEKDIKSTYEPINDNTTKYINLHEDLNYFYNLWVETRISIANFEVNNDLKNSVNNITLETKILINQVEEIEGNYLSLKLECNNLLNRVSIIRKSIADARNNIVKNLLIAEQPRLDISIKEYLNDTVQKIESNRIENAYGVVKNFQEKQPSFVYVILIVFLLFFGILIIIQKKFRTYSLLALISQTPGTKLLMRKPGLFSIILTWMVIALVYKLPTEMRYLIQVVMLIPMLILLRNFFGKYKVFTIVIFVGLYLFKIVMFLLNNQNLMVRFGYLGLALLLILFIWYIFSVSNILDRFLKWGWAIRLLLFVIFIAMTFASFFLIAGNVFLAIIIINGAIGATITAVVLYVSYEMLNSMFQIILILPGFQKSNIIYRHNKLVLSYLGNILRFVFLIAWINISLNNMALKKEVIEGILFILNYKISIGSTTLALNNIIAFILTIYVSILISRIVLFVLEEEVFIRRNTSKGKSGIINLLFRYSIISLGFIYALAVAGIKMENISILIGALSVGIGFGLQSIFNNLVSGVILALERPIKVGDTIQLDELIGTVNNIGIRTSSVRTYDGAEVIVPNGDLVSNQIINWTLSDRNRRLIVNVGVSYDSDPNLVIEILKEVTENHEDVVKIPSPTPRFVGFGESSLDFQIRFWIADFENGITIETDILLKIFKKLKENGIEIPYPKRDIRIIRNK